MPKAADNCSGWIRKINVHPIARHKMGTNNFGPEEALGWLDYLAEIEDVGMSFLRARGHAPSSRSSYRLFQAFIRQGKTFYRSAEALDYRSSPLNYYYAFLNLAKAYILVNQSNFTGRRSRHGLGVNIRSGSLSNQFVSVHKSGVFHNLYREITGVQLRKSVQLNVATLLGYCTDISLEYELGKFGKYRGVPSIFAILHDNQKHNSWPLVAVRSFDNIEPYKKSLKAFNDLMEEVSLPNSNAKEIFEIPGEFVSFFRFFESRQRYAYTPGKIPIGKIVNDWIGAAGPFFTVQPYNEDYDFILEPPLRVTLQMPMREPLAIYALIFFLGSLVRYRPDFLESLLTSRDAWIIERFAKSAPQTLLLYMRNLIANQNFAYIPR